VTEAGVAVVGMACRYPDAPDVSSLWDTVIQRRRAFRRIPESRLSHAYHGGADETDRTYVTRAALLEGWTFDRAGYRVPARVHRAVDPTHWLALETCRHALGDAGHPDGSGLDRARVGVVLGNSLTGEFTRAAQLRYRWPYVQRTAAAAMRSAGVDDVAVAAALRDMAEQVSAAFPAPNDESLAGALSNTIAGRVCNYFDFGAGGYTVDGACSSSLLAIIAAARSLVAGEADFVLAGGIDLSLDPFELVGFARLGALAHGEMRVYDREPTGFLPGEGCGVVALMRTADARAAGVRSYAEISGWGVSSDGSGGITRPEVEGQLRALRAAYEMSRLDPAAIDLIEGHGTGTGVGDDVELEALNRLRERAPGVLGSVKANIGHTKAAAGTASFIKAVTAIHRRVLPPMTGTRAAHPKLSPDVSGLTLPERAAAWPAAVPRAGVSSMGFGGINSHVVLSGVARDGMRHGRAPRERTVPQPDVEVVAVEAGDIAALVGALEMLARNAASWSEAEFHDAAATAAHEYRGLAPARCGLVAQDPDELAAAAAAAATALRAGAVDDVPIHLDVHGGYALGSGPAARVGLLFPGQAAPVRASLPAWADTADVPAFSAGLRLADGNVETSHAQPAIIRSELAALSWLGRLGVAAHVSLGHSVGEISALCWAGALQPREALLLAERRGRIMSEHGRAGTGMLMVAADPATTRALAESVDADVVVACENGPADTVVAGPVADLDRLCAAARAGGTAATTLAVSHGFHSPAMRPALAPLRAALDEIQFDLPIAPVVSTVTGEVISSSADLRAQLTRQLVDPVRFTTALATASRHCDLFIEAGPGRALTGLAQRLVETPVVPVDVGGPARAVAFAAAALAAAGDVELHGWAGRRRWRTRPTTFVPALLANPCEQLSGGRDGEATEAVVPLTAEAAAPQGATTLDSAQPRDALTLLRADLARRAELDVESLAVSCSPLRDLHISSLELRHCVQGVCAELGVSVPDIGLDLSDADIADIAAVVQARPAAGTADDAPPAGVAHWVLTFEHAWRAWKPDAAGQTAQSTPAVVDLGDAAAPDGVATVLRAAIAEGTGRLVIRHRRSLAAAGFARMLAVEQPALAVTVVDESAGPCTEDWAAVSATRGYRELRTTSEGGLEHVAPRRVPMTGDAASTPHDEGVALGDRDVVVVTGGASGITARCVAELVAGTGCRVVVLGRSAADTVTAGLAALERCGCLATYLRCDLSDPRQVSAAVAELGRYGPVRAIVHGAAVNRPQAWERVADASLRDAWAPKVLGLRTLLDAVGDEPLRLVVGFGSVIGRFGLPGQADYAIANDGLRVTLEEWAVAHPQVRVRCIEWSVWSDVGMGVDLGVLDGLRRAGVEPIPAETGTRLFRRIVADPNLPVTVLATGRLPELPTWPCPVRPGLMGRFQEDVRRYLPETEVVADSELSLGDDSYLLGHQIGGAAVVPAVLELEAVAQAAEFIADGGLPLRVTDLALPAPTTVDGARSTTLRVAVLDGNEGLRAVVRSGEDGFASERLTARIGRAERRPAPGPAAEPPGAQALAGSAFPATGGYGGVLFHGDPFRVVRCYDLLSAYRVRAWIHPDPQARWFASLHESRLLLGDPATHDASLHALLPAVPLRLALPVGCDAWEVFEHPSGWLLVDAVERAHTATEFWFDVELRRPGGAVVSRWSGLRLRAVERRTFPGGVPVELAGPLLARALGDAGLAHDVELVSGPGRRADGSATRLLTGSFVAEVEHTPAGRPSDVSGALVLSASYTGDHVLAGASARRFGVDWQALSALDAGGWRDVTAAGDGGRAEAVAGRLGSSPEAAHAVLWCAREALRKAAGTDAGPLDVRRGATDAVGVPSVVFGAGEWSVLGVVIPVAGLGDCAGAVAVERAVELEVG
jgi:enediyne polyketide synthase